MIQINFYSFKELSKEAQYKAITTNFEKLYDICSYFDNIDMSKSIQKFCDMLDIGYNSDYGLYFKDIDSISIEDIRNIKDCDIIGVYTDSYITDIIQQGIKENKSVREILTNIAQNCDNFFDKIASTEYIAECLTYNFENIYFTENGKLIYISHE